MPWLFIIPSLMCIKWLQEEKISSFEQFPAKEINGPNLTHWSKESKMAATMEIDQQVRGAKRDRWLHVR